MKSELPSRTRTPRGFVVGTTPPPHDSETESEDDAELRAAPVSPGMASNETYPVARSPPICASTVPPDWLSTTAPPDPNRGATPLSPPAADAHDE